MENYSGSDMAWYRGGSVAAAVVIKVVLWSELVSLALGSGLCQVFGGIEGALIHKGGHRQFLPCMGVAFYPDSIGFNPFSPLLNLKRLYGNIAGKIRCNHAQNSPNPTNIWTTRYPFQLRP